MSNNNHVPVIHDWHRPSNEGCPQNYDIHFDCTCIKPKRARKLYRVVRVHDDEVPHRVRPDIILEIHPNGRLVFREKGRPRSKALATTVATVYGRLLMNHGLQLARERAAARKAKRKGRK